MIVNMFNVFRECRHKTAGTALISELPNLPKFPAGECSQTPPPQKLTPFFLDDTEWQRGEAVFRVLCHLPKCIQFCSDYSLLDFRYFYTTYIFKRVFWLTRTITRSRGFAPSFYTFALFSRTKPRFQVRRNSKLVYSTFCNFSHQS